MQIKVCDRASFAVNTKRTYTDEGFLIVPGRVARTGTQEYLASELGITDRSPNDIIIVHRPEASVFEQASLDSYNGADITIEHPSSMIDAESHGLVSKGVVRGVGKRDGDFVDIELMIKSRDAINAVESGKVQLSAGYTAIYDEAPKDSPYDFIQREIRINHVALVDRARAGAQARLFDNKPGVKTMTVKVTLDSGKSVDVENEAAATLVTDCIERLTKRAEDAEQATIDVHENLEKVQAEKDAHEEELEEEKKKSSDDSIAKRVEAIANTNDNARKIAGDKFTCDSVNLVDIQRAALTVKRSTVDWKDKSDIYVQTSFDAALEQLDAEPTKTPGQLTQFALDAAKAKSGEEVKLSAYDTHKDKLANAWQMKGE